MATHPTMNDLFNRLDKWRHFPAFPLEARSEVLFALFLPTVLEKSKCVGVKTKPHIIPQFPLKKRGNNQSKNVDFFALSEDGTRAFLIELKTDMKSRRTGQDKYLKKSATKSMDEILRDLKKIVQASTEKKKYYYLLNALSKLGLTELSPGLECLIYKNSYKGISKSIENKIDKICILKPCPKIEVVYIQPREPQALKYKIEGFKYIYFKEFAECIKDEGELGKVFAGYLREWTKDPAKHPPQ